MEIKIRYLFMEYSIRIRVKMFMFIENLCDFLISFGFKHINHVNAQYQLILTPIQSFRRIIQSLPKTGTLISTQFITIAWQILFDPNSPKFQTPKQKNKSPITPSDILLSITAFPCSFKAFHVYSQVQYRTRY